MAPAGKTWVCCACGRTSRTMYGFDENDVNCADDGWDESCMLNARLFDDALLERNARGRVVRVRDEGGV